MTYMAIGIFPDGVMKCFPVKTWTAQPGKRFKLFRVIQVRRMREDLAYNFNVRELESGQLVEPKKYTRGIFWEFWHEKGMILEVRTSESTKEVLVIGIQKGSKNEYFLRVKHHQQEEVAPNSPLLPLSDRITEVKTTVIVPRKLALKENSEHQTRRQEGRREIGRETDFAVRLKGVEATPEEINEYLKGGGGGLIQHMKLH